MEGATRWDMGKAMRASRPDDAVCYDHEAGPRGQKQRRCPAWKRGEHHLF